MAHQSWKASLWFIERTPDFVFWFILIISLIVMSSGFRIFHKARTNQETTYKINNISKWIIFGLSMLNLGMIVGIFIYRIEVFYGINPYYTTYTWKLYLFIGFLSLVMLSLWIYKGIITKMFIEWKTDLIRWYKKLFSKNEVFQKEIIKEIKISSPANGKLKKLENVKDEVFSKKIMGEGIAIVPTSGNIYAPVSGTMETVFNTKHAYGIRTKEGIALLIHIGIDTVKLKGVGFKALIKQGDTVKKGELIAKVDLKKLKSKKVITDIIVLVLPESNINISLPKISGNVTTKSTIIKTVEKELEAIKA